MGPHYTLHHYRALRPVYLGVVLGLMSCSPRVITKTEVQYQDRVEYRDRIVRDTVHESVTDYIYVRGDTIFRDVTKIMYKERVRVDTAYVQRVDSIPYAVVQEKIIETNHLRWWQKTLAWIGFMTLIVLGLVFILRKR